MARYVDKGHVFIVNGDLTKIACDALLIPTDGMVNITRAWREFLAGLTYPSRFKTRVMRALPARPKQPLVWLGDLAPGYGEVKKSVFEDTIEEFVEQASTKVRRMREEDRIYHWPKPRLAVNVIGTGYGGASHIKGQLLTVLIRTLEALAESHDVDLILVAYGEKAYAAAQRARRQLSTPDLTSSWNFHPAASPELAQWAQHLANAAITSRLVLFIGAGVSAGAGAPTWGALLSEVATTAGFDDDSLPLLGKKDPRDQATLIERRLHSIDKELRIEVANTLRRTVRYSLQHGLLTSLPSSEAVTTNFDDLFESAARTGGRRLSVLPEDPEASDNHWLLKLHGTVDHPENIVLTRSDYLDMPRQYGALIGLVQGMLLMRHMMFVGYSLQDEDFQELIHEVRKARGDVLGRSGTVLTLFHDDLEREIWSGDLDVVPMIAGADRPVGIEVAARELEVFLDLVGFLSTTSAAFFLDPTYASLSDDEALLRETLDYVARLTHDASPGSVAYEVKRFLEGLGSDS
jgi:NAD-dependent SIR2 family protein deacetylase